MFFKQSRKCVGGGKIILAYKCNKINYNGAKYTKIWAEKLNLPLRHWGIKFIFLKNVYPCIGFIFSVLVNLKSQISVSFYYPHNLKHNNTMSLCYIYWSF